MWFKFFLVSCLAVLATATDDEEGIIYDKFTHEPVTEEALKYFEDAGITSKCAMRVKTCDETEMRRIDGSCNNLKKPSTGTFLVPQERVLPANYHNITYTSRSQIVDGKESKTPREIREKMLMVGKSVNLNFTQAVPFYGIFSFTDVGSVHDINYFLLNKTDCCEPGHLNDEMCTPLIVKDDDPVHILTKTRCFNLTKPLDHQFLGCTNDSTPSPISETTGVLDMSQLYNAYNGGETIIRSYEGGELAMEIDDKGTVWPPNGSTKCIANIWPEETRCYKNYGGALLGSMLLTLWTTRNHNHYAREFAKVNPSWTDDQLFYAARNLNIATHLKTLYYEWFATITGEEFMIQQGLKSADGKRRDVYDENKPPKATLEFIYILRYFHTATDGRANKYDCEGNIIGDFSMTQLLARTGYLDKDDNLHEHTPFLNLQPCASIDHGVDPDFADIGLPLHLQAAADIIASDLHKGDTLGMAPYIDYVEYFTGKTINNWEDLEDRIEREQIELMKTVYDDVTDIQLMVGAWSEKIMDNGSIPEIVAYIIADYFKKNMESDRFWYQRADAPGGYTDAQLEEIETKHSLARLICTNADNVTQVQKHAFRVVSDENPLVDCSEIPQIDFSLFAESSN